RLASLATLSPAGLRDSRILTLSSKGISLEGGGETVPAVSHSLRSGWFVVAIPAAEPSRNPGDEGKGMGRMRIFLPQRFAFEFLRQTFEGDGKVRVDHVARRTRAAVSRIDKLDGADGARQPDGCEIEHALGVDHLAVIEGQTVALERSEDLLDAPAQ